MNMLERLMSFSETEFSQRRTIVDLLRERGHYKMLLMALKETHVDDYLRRPGPFTVFAPTDTAFQSIPKLAGLLGDERLLKSVLYRHICAGRFDLASLQGVAKLRPIEGDLLEASVRKTLIQDAHIVEPDIKARNGIIHGIDKVLIRDNYSWLREVGAQIEEKVKAGSERADAWILSGTQKLEEAIVRTLKS